MARMVDAEPKSKVVVIPDILSEKKSSEEVESLKEEECTALEALLEPVVNPPNSDDLDLQSESVESAYIHKINKVAMPFVDLVSRSDDRLKSKATDFVEKTFALVLILRSQF